MLRCQLGDFDMYIVQFYNEHIPDQNYYIAANSSSELQSGVVAWYVGMPEVTYHPLPELCLSSENFDVCPSHF